jgi:hypothetical protein
MLLTFKTAEMMLLRAEFHGGLIPPVGAIVTLANRSEWPITTQHYRVTQIFWQYEVEMSRYSTYQAFGGKDLDLEVVLLVAPVETQS